VTLLNVERQTSHARTSYGPGKSPDWHSDREISLKDEVDLIDPVLAQAGHFIDFWMGAGSRDATPPQRKPAMPTRSPVLRDVRVVEFPGLGHLAPVTHPEVINAEIARFLGEVSPAGVGVEVDAFCLEAMAAEAETTAPLACARTTMQTTMLHSSSAPMSTTSRLSAIRLTPEPFAFRKCAPLSLP
jgi:hypothetical protein